MKRIGNIYHKIANIENLRLADLRARKGKSDQKGIAEHDKNREQNLVNLLRSLQQGTYSTSNYKTFKVYEPKEREVFMLPYCPDRIAHHAIMNVLEAIFMAHFTADTYSCIKRRGIHGVVRNVKAALTDQAATMYCLKLDIVKFYPNVDHQVLKAQLRRKFKDKHLLWLLDEIIDSAPGLPIGNYLSQYLANFYLSQFDHWVKETKRVSHYFRYADDLVFLAPDKAYLHQLLFDVRQYMHDHLKLSIKGNYQVFPVAARSIDFVGYRFYHTHTMVRKSIKKSFAREVNGRNRFASVASYAGWLKHCNGKHLLKTLIPNDHSKTI